MHSAPGTRPAVFLDRDGTLVEERNYLSRPAQVRLLPHAAAAIRSLREAGFLCVVVSNQSGVGRGYFTGDQLQQVHEEMMRQLRAADADLDGCYYCTLAPGTPEAEGASSERKPGSGMLVRAAAELGIDLARSWTIGDSPRDIVAGRNAGCRGGVLVRTGHDLTGAEEELGEEVVIMDDLEAAARYVLAQGQSARSSG